MINEMCKRYCVMGPVRLSDLSDYLTCNAKKLVEFYGLEGTGGTPVVEYVKTLLSNGYKVTVVTLDDKLKLELIELNGFHDQLNVFVVRRSRNPSRSMFFFEGLRFISILKKYYDDFCVIHANWPIYSFWPMLVFNKRMLVTLHDNPVNCTKILGYKNVVNLLFSLMIYKYAENLSVVSSHIVRHVSVCRSQKKKKVAVVRNILRLKGAFNKSNDKDRGSFYTCLMIGNNNKLKNIYQTLQTVDLHYLYRYHIVFDLYGPGMVDKFYENQNSLIDIVYNSAVPHSVIIKAMASMDFLLHPSLEEAFPGPIFESVLMGKPVICKPVGDLPNIFSGTSGVVFYEDDNSLPNVLCDFIDNYNENCMSVLDLQGYVQEITSPDVVLKDYFEIYKKIQL